MLYQKIFRRSMYRYKS